jgi:uncharacterized protein (UPF0264 family)
MPQLLISVTSVDEAKLALENGADFIDIKDPTQGALGALSIDKIQEITAFVHAQIHYGKRQVSATIGDLPMQAELILEHVLDLAKTNVDIIKIGFFETADYQTCLDQLKLLSQRGVKLIAVLFAEFVYPESLLVAIKQAGFYGLMIDTALKDSSTYLNYYSESEMTSFSEMVNKQGLIFGIAGSLNIQHIDIVKRTNPTYIGFRGGVSEGNQRTQRLDPAKILAISQLM